METVLTTQNLTIGYKIPRHPAKTVASDLSVSLHRGQLVCLLGPNGAGKSTLLRTLTAMQPALGGEVRVLGDDIRTLKSRELARRVSVVLTDSVNVGSLSAYGLVALGRHPHTNWLGELTEEDDEIIRRAIEAVDAVDLAARCVGELSDGERQKIMIARALAQSPSVLVLDEPTAFLDLPHRANVMRILRDLARTTGQAILLSTHDLDLALRSADRIWLMGADGTLQVGAPEDLVLNGSFQETFCNEGIEFDTLTGSFKINTERSASVAVVGEGLSAAWTRRALHRAGYNVAPEEQSPAPEEQIEVTGFNGTSCWRHVTPQHTSEFSTIEELISAIDQHHHAHWTADKLA